jgi:hypothetical protein
MKGSVPVRIPNVGDEVALTGVQAVGRRAECAVKDLHEPATPTH